MTVVALKNSKIFVVALCLGFLASCVDKKAQESSSRLFSLDTESRGEVPGGSDPKALCGYLKDNGYFPKNSYEPNTKLLFSTSYGIVKDAAGQGYGVIDADGRFVQQGNTTSQLILCPGASNLGGGKCSWQINGDNGYAQLAYDVVCNNRSRSGTKIHPGYDRQKANLVSYKASTAKRSTSGQDAVEVILESRHSKARIVFGKNVGLVSVVFQEELMPTGTSEVFIDSQSGGLSRAE